MKYVLRVAGVLAIIIGLYIIVGEQLVGSSGNAFINTKLAPIRAPITGQVEIGRITDGATVRANQSIGTVSVRAAQTDRTLDYRRELALAIAERDAAEAFEAGTDFSGFDPAYERSRLSARVAALQELLSDQEAAQSSAVSGTLVSPVNGLVWSAPVNSPVTVQEGETVAWIARCDTIFVHAHVDERLYNRLSPGDEAQFRMADGNTIDATVTLMAGTGPRSLIETLAIEPSGRDADGFTVFLAAPALTSSDECVFGRTGRVIFSRGPLAALGDWLAQVGL
ncbi:HlyD family efflux transporter periplasmic adaptor subunit [Pelagibacterium lentulum]|uniref:RND efflux pump membrane fusion protein barrel-sandwich domain-containing protein n=1 Tax=Pelagibacterium lentulum TaxID=2029865 RepID=A0A916VXC1_9HYPH|nr:HlyD family efflux transporter periplasmic adaptor subunit [Pelagibacterium lentulum]GGA50566.1 hypothetical protein GCM10011499_20660 [Pelagibacterium lentulum]